MLRLKRKERVDPISVKQDIHQQADRIFSKALDLPLEAREGFLVESCGDDDDLQREVELLLKQYGSTEKALSSTDPSHTLSAGEPEEGAIAAPGAGDLLANFRLLERLEDDSHDRFMAEAEGSRQRVLLEVLGPELDNSDVRRIRVDAETITRLDHSGLLSLLEIGTAILGTGPRAFIVTDAHEHQRLEDWAMERSPSLQTRIKMASRLVEAMAFAHGRGILDGNLHPGRILVDELGKPMISGMGLSRILRAPIEPAPDGISCRAPESVDTPWSRMDVRADIYAIGGILEWLFRDELQEDHEAVQPMRQVINRAHAHDPEARYASADAMVLDLHRLEQEPDGDDQQSFMASLWSLAAQHPVACLVSGTVLMGILVTLIALLATGG